MSDEQKKTQVDFLTQAVDDHLTSHAIKGVVVRQDVNRLVIEARVQQKELEWLTSLLKRVYILDEFEKLQKENEQLKLWKESEIKLWLPVLEYMHGDKTLKLGASISDEVLKRLKAYDARTED